ncbi:MAG TPA: alpha/beta fold hydrolase [Prolixibacteraceae bacterium]|nr:alpha/beta fold hydrolase [Prolixibacteraceae bacterium]
MRILNNIVLLGALTLILSSCKLAEKKTNQLNYDFSEINKKVQGWIDSGYYSGAGLIIAKDNQLILDTCYGNYTADTVVYIASSGKWLAAATIAAVVDEGKLSWDDPVNKWLPEFTNMKGKATLRQLLSHTSGFPDYQPQGAHHDDYQTLEESVSNIVGLPADTIPGAEFNYGGLAMQVAGRMAELATGKDWETLFQEKIAQPLGMKNTHFTPVNRGGGHSPMLGGGARTVLHDYAAFLNMIFNNGKFNGKQVLSEVTIKEMQADQIGKAKVAPHEFVERVRAEMHHGIYGLGEWREELNSAGEAVLISSPSWAGAYPWIDKTTNTYGFFITHITGENAGRDGFSSFFSSPVLPIMVRDVYKQAALPDSVKTGFFNIGDAKIYYEEAGHGEPVIFIHGHSFDHSEWDPQFLEFAKKYRTIRYDCRGYGRSSMPVEGHEFLHAEDLLNLMDILDVEKAHLVGLSMGGFIVADMLALHPNRILTATAASGDVFPVPGPDQPWTEEGIAKRRAEIAATKAHGTMNQKWEWLAGLMSKGGSHLQEIRRPVWDMIYKWDQWQTLHVEPRLVLGTSVVEILKNQEITVPVMVLTGEVDKNRPNKLLECVPTAKQVIVPDAGHVSNLENPEAFTKLVMQFIDRKSIN